MRWGGEINKTNFRESQRVNPHSFICCAKTTIINKNVAYVQHFYYFCSVKHL